MNLEEAIRVLEGVREITDRGGAKAVLDAVKVVADASDAEIKRLRKVEAELEAASVRVAEQRDQARRELAQVKEARADLVLENNRFRSERDEAIKYLGGMNPGETLVTVAKRTGLALRAAKSLTEDVRQVREALGAVKGEDLLAAAKRVKAEGEGVDNLRKMLAEQGATIGELRVTGEKLREDLMAVRHERNEAEQKARNAFVARDSFREELDRERRRAARSESELRQIELCLTTIAFVPTSDSLSVLRAKSIVDELASERRKYAGLADENARYRDQIANAVRTIDALREEVKKHEALEARLEERAKQAEKSEDTYKDLATKYQNEKSELMRKLSDERSKPLRVIETHRCTCEKWCICGKRSGRS